jgi:hypothetical protein
MESEDVDQFFDRCSVAVDKAHYTYTDAQKATPEYREQFKAFVFVWFSKGLKEEIRVRVMAAATPPTELDPMLAAARKVESELKRMNDKAKNGNNLAMINSCDPHDQEGTARRIEELTRELGRLRASRPFAGKCHGCGKMGHMKRDCRSGGNNNRGNYPNRGGFRGYRGGGGGQRRGGYQTYRGQPSSSGFRGGFRGGRGGGGQYHSGPSYGNNNRYQRGGFGGGQKKYYVIDNNEGNYEDLFEEVPEYCEGNDQ